MISIAKNNAVSNRGPVNLSTTRGATVSSWTRQHEYINYCDFPSFLRKVVCQSNIKYGFNDKKAPVENIAYVTARFSP